MKAKKLHYSRMAMLSEEDLRKYIKAYEHFSEILSELWKLHNIHGNMSSSVLSTKRKRKRSKE